MSLERWVIFSQKQQFGNIAAELARASSQLEKGNKHNCILALYRVLVMLDYQKSVNTNKEIFRFYEYVASLTINPEKNEINACVNYCLSFAI